MNFNEIKRDFTRYKATYILSIITLLVWLWQFFTYGISATSAINLFNSGAILGQVCCLTQAKCGVCLRHSLSILVGHTFY